MKSVLEYKGYHTKLEIDTENLTIRGKIEGINDYVDFECSSLSEVEREFHSAVDDYLAFCEELGKEPEKEYKGTFNVRISPELHKQLAVEALKNGDSLNTTVEKAVSNYLSNLSESARTITEAIGRLMDTVTGTVVALPKQETSSLCAYGVTKPYRPAITSFCELSQ